MIRKLIKTIFEKSRTDEIISNSPYKDTLLNPYWIVENIDDIKRLLPEVWTHEDNFDLLKFGFKLKIMDVPWQHKSDLRRIIRYFEQFGIVYRKNNYLIKVNHSFTLKSSKVD